MGLRVEEWDLLAVVQLAFVLVGAYVVLTRGFDWLFGHQLEVPENERGDD